MQLNDEAIIAAVGELLTEERSARIALQARVDELTEQRQIPEAMVPPELAEQVKAAIHLLHESPPIEHRNAPQPSGYPIPLPRPSRIERDEGGGYTLIYDEPKP